MYPRGSRPSPWPPGASSHCRGSHWPVQFQPCGLRPRGLEPGSIPVHRPLCQARLHVCCGVAGTTPVSPLTQLGFNVDGASRCLLGRGPGSGVADERVDGGRGRASITHPRSLAGCGLLSPLLPEAPPPAQECARHSYSQYPQGGPVGLCALWTDLPGSSPPLSAFHKPQRAPQSDSESV